MARTVLSLGNFFSVAHFYLIAYIIAPYLATFMPQTEAGLVVSGGAIVTLLIFPHAPRLVEKYGARKIAIALGTAEALILFSLAAGPGPIAAIILVALACATSPLIAYQLDLMLEATVEEESQTGRIRTAFLTAGNAALICAPLLVGLLLDSTERYDRVFLAAAVSLLPFIFLLIGRRFPKGEPPIVLSQRETLKTIFRDPDLRATVGASFMLQSLYQFAQIYIPLYLHTVLGISWSELGWVFAVMLLPFVLLEYPAGILADKMLGDGKLMILGFIIAGLGYGLVSTIHSNSPIPFILFILIATRVGGALIEAMAEGHFFRRVSERDASIVSVFRTTRPGAALFAPLFGSLILSLFGYEWLFIISGAVLVFVGVVFAVGVEESPFAHKLFTGQDPI
jgi:MFS family permease